jgi:hypothetical protein
MGSRFVKSWILTGAAAAALVSLGVASATRAEPPIGSRLGDRLEKNKVKDERESVQAAHQLAGCIVVKRGSIARGILDSRDEQQVKKFESQSGGTVECMANISRNDLVDSILVMYPGDIMRGDIAEELLKRNRSAMQQLQPLPMERTYSRPWYVFTGRHVSLDEMATCVANTNPAAIAALINSEPFSGDEDSAFGTLIPVLGPCLVAGTKLDARREPLRAALAEALYQRAFHPEENVPSAAPDSQASAQK